MHKNNKLNEEEEKQLRTLIGYLSLIIKCHKRKQSHC